MPLQIRRGTEAERQAMTIPLAIGEPLYVTDTGSIWIGDGASPGGTQVTGLTLEDAVDSAAAALVAGVNQNITFIYGPTQDAANRIDAVLDLSTVEGTISADGFKGPILADDSGLIVDSSNRNIFANDISANDITVNDITGNDLILTGDIVSSSIISDLKGSVFSDNSTVLVNSVEGSINLIGTIKTDVIPSLDSVYDLGEINNRFRNLYLRNGGLYIDNALITGDPFGTINLPAGSTVGGQPISVLGNLTGDLNANIIGDDSSVILDVSSRQVFADVTGNVIGDLIGNVTGDLTGNILSSNSSVVLDTDNFILSVDTIILDNATISSEDDKLRIDVDNNDLQIRCNNISAFNSNFILETISNPDLLPGIATNQIGMQSYRGTLENPNNLQIGDQTGSFSTTGFVNNTIELKSAIVTSIDVAGTTNNFTSKVEIFIHDYEGNYTAASLNSRGVFSSKVIQTGVFIDNADRDSKVGTPAKGMIVFNDNTGKFQGYDGTNWVDLN